MKLSKFLILPLVLVILIISCFVVYSLALADKTLIVLDSSGQSQETPCIRDFTFQKCQIIVKFSFRAGYPKKGEKDKYYSEAMATLRPIIRNYKGKIKKELQSLRTLDIKFQNKEDALIFIDEMKDLPYIVYVGFPIIAVPD